MPEACRTPGDMMKTCEILAFMPLLALKGLEIGFKSLLRSRHVFLPSFSDLFSVGMVLEVAGVGSYGFYSFAVIVTVPTLRNQMKNPKKTAPAAILVPGHSLFDHLKCQGLLHRASECRK